MKHPVVETYLKNKKLVVSLLAYNEAETLEQTIRQGYSDLINLGYNFELWLFDNRSTDATKEICERLATELPQFKYFQQPENIGYAFSTLTTFKIPQADVYVTIDGDGQYTFNDIPTLVAKLAEGSDLVYANREVRNDPMPRIIMSYVFNIITKILLKTNIRDLNCGFRAMTSQAAHELNIYYQLNFVGPEIYVRAKQKNFKIADVSVLHFSRRGGLSVYTGLPTILKNVCKMLNYIFSLRNEMNCGKHPNRPLLYFESK